MAVQGETSWNFVRGSHKLHQSRELGTRAPYSLPSLSLSLTHLDQPNVADLVHDAIMIMRGEEI